MNDSADRRMRVIANGIGSLAWTAHQLLSAGDELSPDRIVRIACVDQRGNVRRHRDRIPRSDLFQLRKRTLGRETVRNQLRRGAQCCGWVYADFAHDEPGGGVATTR